MTGELGLITRFTRYANRALLRNPGAAFSVIFLPLFFLVVFTFSFGSDTLVINGRSVPNATFTLAAILVYAIAQACYTNLAIGTTIARDHGFLKRIRGTPIPPRAYLLGQAINAVEVSVVLVTIAIVFAAAIFGVRLPVQTVPALVVTLVLGATTFAILGLAVTTLIPNASAATAVVNVSIFPLFFASNVFIPFRSLPTWFDALTRVFPVKPFSEALKLAMVPPPGSTGFAGWDLLELAGWATIGLGVALRWFRWTPSR